ncbi:MAG TPA: GGDEF and EAL domain-containing protein [Rhizomicrobium sp.]|nr:GGDEF and EAL domain-containing protein [Rhizomicrobium sp.]
MRRLAFAAALAAMALAGLAAAAPQKDTHKVDFGGSEAVMELGDALGPYSLPKAAQPRSAAWYTFTAVNSTKRPATRVLHAGQPASEALRILPRPTRPAIIALASADPSVIVEKAKAFGGRAYLVTIPPETNAPIAIEIANAGSPPSLLAWTEPALAAHNRQLGIFIAAVAGLIFAAAAIATGLAVMSGHRAPFWAAAALAFVLLSRLAATGMFDASLATRVGGPYGLTAAFAGLALAAGARLANAAAPVTALWPKAGRPFYLGVIGLAVLSALAYLGAPAATDLTYLFVVLGSGALAAYLVHRGGQGVRAARMLAPSATVFALVALAGTLSTFGLLGETTLAPDIGGGFAAAGAVLLALAIAAGEGFAILPGARRHALHEAHPIALTAIGASHQGIFDLEFDAGEVVLSREAAALLGLGEAEGRMSHDAWLARIHDEDRPVYEQALANFRAQCGLAFRIEFRARSQSGRFPWFELRATMMGEGQQASRCLGLIADITARKEAEPAADNGRNDALTGLPNRAALLARLKAIGAGLRMAILALLDIDRFKAIHASLGDEGADAVLARASERLRERFGGDAEVYRYGGDAFALLFSKPAANAAAIGAEIAETCAGAYAQGGRSVFAPASIGLAEGREAESGEALAKNAELALMNAKRDGGGCARIFEPSMNGQPAVDAVALETELREALERDELELYYQPIVRLASEAVAGFEALVRWRHPTKGLIAPKDFVPHSEETGFIVELGHFALERAARDLAQWQRFFPVDPPLFVSVNLSRRQLRDPEFERLLEQTLAASGVAPGTLKLEVTENAIDADAQAALGRIRQKGAGLAIDDFGVGQSSLSRLKDIPFDTVKIDRSFISRPETASGEGAVVLRSIVALAHELKRDVVAEGVETAEDARRVRDIGCEFAQGFYFSPPLSLAEALNYVARRYGLKQTAKSASGAAGLGGQARDVGAERA